MKKINLKRGRALIIVAHPDDETIWMGGVILGHKNIRWTIMSLCRKDDSERMPRFLNVSGFYRAAAVISDLDDTGELSVLEIIPAVKKRIRRQLKEKKFDYVFTHGSGGEYGHKIHRGVHLAVRQMLEKKELVAPNHFYFAYQPFRGKKFCLPDPKAGFCFKLSGKEFKKKQDIVKKMYGFSEFSFEKQSCAKTETFNMRSA